MATVKGKTGNKPRGVSPPKDFLEPRSYRAYALTGAGSALGQTEDDEITKGERIIMQTLCDMNKKLDSFNTRLTLVETWKSEAAPKMDALETSMAAVMQRVTSMATTLENEVARASEAERFCEGAVAMLLNSERHIEHLETRLRAPNLRIVGFLLLKDETTLQQEVQTFLLEKVLLDKESTVGGLMRVQRLRTRDPDGRRKLMGGSVLAVLHNDRERELLLKAAALRKVLMYGDARVHIFPDVSREVAARRAEFRKMRQHFLDKGCDASVRFPAKLVVTKAGKPHVFTEVKAATAFLENLDSAG